MRGTRIALAAAVAAVGLVIAGSAAFGAEAAGAGADDGYIRGYVSAVVEREVSLPASDVTGEKGQVRVVGTSLSAPDRDRLAEVIRRVRGVTGVHVSTVRPASHPTVASVGAAATQAAKEAVAVAAAPVKVVTAEDHDMGFLPS